MSRRADVLPWETPGEEPRREEGGREKRAEGAPDERAEADVPKRQPGETGLAYARRLASEWHGLEVPPEDPPPPPPGKLRVPKDVVPYRVRLEQIWRGRETGEEG
jgi:hypothetical protein